MPNVPHPATCRYANRRLAPVLIGLFLSCLMVTGCIPPELAKQIPFPIPGVTPPPEGTDEAAAEAEEGEEGEPPLPKKKPKPKPKPVLVGQTLRTVLPTEGLQLASHVFAPPAGVASKPTVLWVLPPVGARHPELETALLYFTRQGYTVVVTDLRGQGQSSQFADGASVSWRLFTPEDWPKLPTDLHEVLQTWAVKPPPALAPLWQRPWVVIAEGTSAPVAAMVAGHWPKPLPKKPLPALGGLVLWTPRLKYKGLDATDALLALKVPLVLTGDKAQPLSGDAWRVMPKLVQGPVFLKPCVTAPHAGVGSAYMGCGYATVWPLGVMPQNQSAIKAQTVPAEAPHNKTTPAPAVTAAH
jgi:pimeloyl-ACP methyl ester carboxylesterase